ncbi:PucR family transcriptional regulator [Phocicoccus pinnipedialis]|uniref:Purine catabolism regulatory protein n=1 Tax=Phocicoccus pinnipedialis TaxID=110845 RepID=A0A6V7RH96_9BACL|nr:PucR family transcriptional regulator [Jeotgalicoccus pinnipedialis]MBP1939158.1 purine catabolism regulator [Jeotgalicoccus pinnipedialis]CAD2076535.1 Purine catabolism regulatory protein [Jeotgalicoccus pinnipedialis]
MVTFQELLNVEHFSALKPLNKNADLTRVIGSADITETPDIKSYVSPNTFLLTTGIFFKDHQEGLITLIDELNKVPIAGLGIKTSRFLNSIDEKVLQHADKLKFPIIEIPENWKLGQAIHEIISYISSDESQKLYFALEVQQRMNNMLIQDHSLERMVNSLAKFLRLPLILVNPFSKVEVKSYQFNNKRMLEEHLRYFQDIYLPEKDKKRVSLDEKYAVFEVPALKYFPYHLIVSDIQNINYPFSLLAIEQAINTLSFAIYKNTKIRATEQDDANLFFKSIIRTTDSSPINMQSNPEFFEHYNFIRSDYYRVFVCGIDKHSDIENSEYIQERYYLTFQWLENVLKSLDESISIFGFGELNKFAILFQKKHEYYIPYLKYLQQEYKRFFKESLSFGIGNEVTEISQIGSAFLEALETYNTHYSEGKMEFLEKYRTRNLEELMQLLPFDKLRPFVNYTLGDLAFPTNTKDKELKNTLKVYMENQFDITKTSNLIYVHRNTVKYRINKCEEILNTDITDPKKSLDIRLALFISETISFE